MLLKRNRTLNDFPYHLCWFGLKPNFEFITNKDFQFSCFEELYLFRFSNINSFSLLNLNHANTNLVNIWFENLDNLIKCFKIKYSSNKSKQYLYEKYFESNYFRNDVFDYKNPQQFYQN